MKKLLLTGLAVLGLVTACVSEKDFDTYTQETQMTINALRNADANNQQQIAELKESLLATTAALQANIDANATNITANAYELVNAVEAITLSLEALSATDADLQSQLDAIGAALSSLNESFNEEIRLISEDIIAVRGNISELGYDLGSVVEDLKMEIEAAESAANAYADANDEVGESFNPAQIQQEIAAVNTRVDGLSTLQSQIDSINTAIDLIDFIDQVELDAAIEAVLLRANAYADANDDFEADTTLDASLFATVGQVQSLTSSLTTIQLRLNSLPEDIATREDITTAIAGVQSQINRLRGENQGDAALIGGLMTSVTNLQNLINDLIEDNDLVDANGFVIADVAMLESNGFVLVPGTPVAYQLTQDDGRVYIVSLNPAGQLVVDGPNGWTDVYDTVSNPGSGSSAQDGVIEGIARQNEVLDAEEAADMLAERRETALTEALENIGSIPAGFSVSRTGNVFTVLRAEDGWTEDITATFVDGSATPIFNFLGGNNSTNLNTAVTRTANAAPALPLTDTEGLAVLINEANFTLPSGWSFGNTGAGDRLVWMSGTNTGNIVASGGTTFGDASLTFSDYTSEADLISDIQSAINTFIDNAVDAFGWSNADITQLNNAGYFEFNTPHNGVYRTENGRVRIRMEGGNIQSRIPGPGNAWITQPTLADAIAVGENVPHIDGATYGANNRVIISNGEITIQNPNLNFNHFAITHINGTDLQATLGETFGIIVGQYGLTADMAPVTLNMTTTSLSHIPHTLNSGDVLLMAGRFGGTNVVFFEVTIP